MQTEGVYNRRMEQLLPLARPDGSTSVGVRFDVGAEGALHVLESYNVEWRRSAHPALLTPLATPPTVEEVSASLVDVVFDGRDRRAGRTQPWRSPLAFRSRLGGCWASTTALEAGCIRRLAPRIRAPLVCASVGE
jgi:hypothetical protein